MQRKPESSSQPLGANGDHLRRFRLHHAPLALISGVILVLFMRLPLFDITAYPHADLVSGTFPQLRGSDAGATRQSPEHSSPAQIGVPSSAADAGMRHGGDHAGAMYGGRQHEVPAGHGRRERHAAPPPSEPAPGHEAQSRSEGHGSGDGRPPRAVSLSGSIQRFTVATGYLALGLLGVTLLLGPANLVVRRRNPVSTYLRRDVGIWTAVFSLVHVIGAVLIHVSHGSGVTSSVVHFFVQDGKPLTNSFGLGNWVGLAASAIVLGLLATSTDAALRRLKARPWKWVQRLNYALFALVILHAFFYGALLRMSSPFTVFLVLSVVAVVGGQAVGIWLWRRRFGGVVTVILLVVFLPSALFAQHGPGRHGADAGLSYDIKTEATVTGTVVEVKSGRSLWSRLFRIHTLGVGDKKLQELQVVLKTDAGTVPVHLGPRAFLEGTKVEIRKGDTLEVTGSHLTLGNAHRVVLAREVRRGGNAWTLRDTAGQPLWSTDQTQPRGFWTAKKVLVTVVVIKVVALATVLRH
jgi:methionine sulfoxide reductase heme-binding subunit